MAFTRSDGDDLALDGLKKEKAMATRAVSGDSASPSRCGGRRLLLFPFTFYFFILCEVMTKQARTVGLGRFGIGGTIARTWSK